MSREMNGKRVEARATILPSAQYGLPTTADQDTYLAILKLATEMYRKHGKVTNPISFTSAEILRIQGKSCVSGYHYKELLEQLMRIKTSTIVSEGTVYFAGRKVWAKDAFNVINRLVLLGTAMEDGTVADKHYVWFSDWQIENINSNYLLPIDYDSYKQLRNHIAKILVPLLQIWLYASREQGCFEKRYEEICQFLNIRAYQHQSKIKEKLGPSLDELTAHGYLSSWRLEKTSDGASYKIVLYHGEKFHRDLRRRPAPAGLNEHNNSKRNQPANKGCTLDIPDVGPGLATAKADPRVGPTLPHANRSKSAKAEPRATHHEADSETLKALTDRGISAERSRELLSSAGDSQQIIDQLEWGDYLIARSRAGKFYNPPGFYVRLIESKVAPPDHFETSHKKRLREEAHKAYTQTTQEQAALELEYLEYRKLEVDRYLDEKVPPQAYQEAIESNKKELQRVEKGGVVLTDQAWTELAVARFRKQTASQLNLMSFWDFCKARKTVD
ncbi:MAG TPA: replication initiator protein A [Terriglobia bacterium]|nr:replication initiator protein A [Terriglobia bacterium]